MTATSTKSAIKSVPPIFSIEFIDGANPETILEELCLYGKITIGAFSERFASPMEFWQVEDYQHQWVEGLSALRDVGRSCLVTAMRDPKTGTFIEVWPIYRIADHVFFQNRILFCDQIGRSFNMKTIYEAIGDRETLSDDGAPISEWRVPYESIHEFLALNRTK